MSPTTHFTATEIPDLHGKTALITGGARGIGLEAAHLLASHNAVVYILSRSRSSFDSALSELSSRLTVDQLSNLHFHPLDLGSIAATLESARTFPAQKIDILIANAGISLDPGKELSPDGFEKMFATNHLGHFALITRLMPRVEAAAKETGDARVVVLSSDAVQFGALGETWEEDVRSLPAAASSGISGIMAAGKRYGRSKSCNAIFAQELAGRVPEGVYVNSCHPGMILNTGLGGDGGEFGVPSIVTKGVRGLAKLGVGFSSREGAMTEVWLATMKEVKENGVKGQFWVPVKGWTRRYVRSAEGTLPEECLKEELRKRLWEVSEEAVRKVEEGM